MEIGTAVERIMTLKCLETFKQKSLDDQSAILSKVFTVAGTIFGWGILASFIFGSAAFFLGTTAALVAGALAFSFLNPPTNFVNNVIAGLRGDGAAGF